MKMSYLKEMTHHYYPLSPASQGLGLLNSFVPPHHQLQKYHEGQYQIVECPSCKQIEQKSRYKKGVGVLLLNNVGVDICEFPAVSCLLKTPASFSDFKS